MYDIIFIGDTSFHNTVWQTYKSRFPAIKSAKDIETAKRICLTKMFWVVWPDIEISKDFDFDYSVDQWNDMYIHVFKNNESYDGVCLIPKIADVTDKELQHRFFRNKKEVDIVASFPRWYDVFNIETYQDYENALQNSKTEMFWMSSNNLKIDNDLVNSFYIPHYESIDRKQNHAFVHRVDGNDLYNGVFLCSKHAPLNKREVEYRFPVNRKEWDIVASGPVQYDVFEIDTYEEYEYALKNSKTEMFWMSSANLTADIPDVYFSFDNEYDRKQNHAFVHRVDGNDLYNGVFLCSKHVPLSKREVDHRFPVNRKEWDIVASGPTEYEKFYVDTYEEYTAAFENSSTEMFWIIPSNINVENDFKFDTYFTHDNTYDRLINHVFLNGKYHDGIVLCSKKTRISQREWHFRFIAAKKEHNILASTPAPYDVVFISYQEPDADKNYQKLLEKIPTAKRVHGVKGIHQAHIAAAKLCSTPMIWIVDGDANIVEDFNFDYQVPAWQYTHVHVWRSKNPVNGLVYGYGGVKLFPRELTLDMDITKPDMTTSISDKFVAVKEISNITGFNTGEFETWKSAFRECCKLASKVIDRQKDDETERRLKIWTSIGRDKPFGEYALKGAREGMAYGQSNKGNTEALKLINNFDWLKEQFDGNI